MSDAPVIRPITATDFDAWNPLWDGYNAFYGREGATALPDAVMQTTWQRFFDSAEPVFALIHGVYAQAQGAGIQRVYWMTHETNAAGRRLYDKVAQHLGFLVYAHDV